MAVSVKDRFIGLGFILFVVAWVGLMSWVIWYSEVHDKVVECPEGFTYHLEAGWGGDSFCLSDNGRVVVNPQVHFIREP